MSAKTVQFGPFTPQEMEALVRELQVKNIPFEIAKDEGAEKDFKAIDFHNLVNQAHLRTSHYMAQIFYITLARADVEKVSGRLQNLGFPTTTGDDLTRDPPELVESPREDIFLKAKVEKKKFNRRMIAWLLLLGLLCLMVIGYAI